MKNLLICCMVLLQRTSLFRSTKVFSEMGKSPFAILPQTSLCLDGYISKSEDRWNLINCAKEGWDPTPKCLKVDEISCVCAREYSPENLHTKVICTKNNWPPSPRSIAAPACEKPLAVDFGGIVSGEQSVYWESDKVQYKRNPGYTLMGPEWITCNGKIWTPTPQCLGKRNFFVLSYRLVL
uniref:Sushi domain-containing protein n=1 Tax=Chrysemys picta bellii TaxID=8478 RepID=A0A8C3IXE0_CHRPI